MIDAILPPSVSAVESFSDVLDEPLFPQERAVIARAVDERRREYTSVRACARMALARLGLPRPPLVADTLGAPRWPDGVVGSMTHCAGYRAAAVARTDHVLALGIDAEPHAPVPEEVLEVIARPQEAAHLAALSSSHPQVSWERLLFSAKESLFKAWYPLTGRWLDFEDVALRIDPLNGTFSVALQVEAQALGGLPPERYNGRWLVARDLVLTTITVSSPGRDPQLSGTAAQTVDSTASGRMRSGLTSGRLPGDSSLQTAHARSAHARFPGQGPPATPGDAPLRRAREKVA